MVTFMMYFKKLFFVLLLVFMYVAQVDAAWRMNPHTRKLDYYDPISGGNHSALSNLDRPSAGHTGNLTINKADPEIKLIDTGDSNDTRITRSDTNATVTRYNTVFKPGATGNALDFDGGDDEAIIAGDGSIDFATGTYAAWVKLRTVTAADTIFHKNRAGNQDGDFRLWAALGSGNFGCTLENGVTFIDVDAGSVLSTGSWHHIGATYDGTTCKVYLDGSLANSGTISAANFGAPSTDLWIGNSEDVSTRVIDGLMDDAVVWSRVLVVTDFSDIWNSGSGLKVDPSTTFPTSSTSMGLNLQGLWHHDESTMNSAPGGKDTTDSSTNSNHGTVDVSMTDSDFVPGIITNAGIDVEVVVWQSKDGAVGGAEGTQLFGPVVGTNIFQGKTLAFKTSAIQRGNITAGGLWGINTSSPAAMLHITTKSATEEGLILSMSASQTANALEVKDSGGNNQVVLGPDGEAVFNEEGNDKDFRVEGSSEDKLFMVDAGTNTVRAGDGDTNYVNFAVDGELTLVGTARVKKIKVVSPTALRLGGTAPEAAIVGNYAVLQFAGVGAAESVYFEGHVPEDWASGTDIIVHIHWAPTNGNAGNVVWQMDWVASQSESDEILTAGVTSTSVTDATQTLQDELLKSGDMTISGGSLALDDVVGIKIYRDSTHASDTYASDASLVLIHFEYLADKLGEAT